MDSRPSDAVLVQEEFENPEPSSAVLATQQATVVNAENESPKLSRSTNTPATTPSPVPKSPVLKPESPSVKRRKSEECVEKKAESHPEGSSPSKRARSAQNPVKILPTKYEFCGVEDMVTLIANMISELIQTNDCLSLRRGVLTRFHSRTAPGISVHDYLQRLAKHATLTPPLLLSMVYYIDRLCSLYPAFTITTLTIHRFLITAATVAAKGLSDSFWNNATYARVGGLKMAELCLLELEFLHRVDWKIVPVPETLEEYYKGLVERSEGYELEGESESSEDEVAEEEEEDESDGLQSPIETATDSKWNAWMEDVSTQQASKGDEVRKERSPEDASKECDAKKGSSTEIAGDENEVMKDLSAEPTGKENEVIKESPSLAGDDSR